MRPCVFNVIFQVYQQDATLCNILYYCQCCTCFRRFLRPSSGAQNSTHNIWYTSSLLAATASGSSKQAWHIPVAVCTVLSSWWWAEKLPEICRALTVIKNVVWRCILLVILIKYQKGQQFVAMYVNIRNMWKQYLHILTLHATSVLMTVTMYLSPLFTFLHLTCCQLI